MFYGFLFYLIQFVFMYLCTFYFSEFGLLLLVSFIDLDSLYTTVNCNVLLTIKNDHYGQGWIKKKYQGAPLAVFGTPWRERARGFQGVPKGARGFLAIDNS